MSGTVDVAWGRRTETTFEEQVVCEELYMGLKCSRGGPDGAAEERETLAN